MTFEEIKNNLKPELDRMNEIIRRSLVSNSELMNSISENYLRIKGKQVRPLMVILSAKMFGEVNQDVLNAGASLEMLHNATLIHDDVVDETSLRRGVPTINARWDNRIAVLVGDFFVSTSLAVAVSTNNVNIVASLSQLGRQLSLGEIDQICNVRQHNLDEESYMQMINRKTASLFVSCVQMGAEAVGATKEEYADLVKFAEILGMCFQIKDDIFDYFPGSEIGKPTGNDLREGKVTMPLLYAINNSESEHSGHIRELLRKAEMSESDISECLEFAVANGGVDYAYKYMGKMREKGVSLLDKYPDSEAKRNLVSLFDYIIARKH